MYVRIESFNKKLFRSGNFYFSFSDIYLDMYNKMIKIENYIEIDEGFIKTLGYKVYVFNSNNGEIINEKTFLFKEKLYLLGNRVNVRNKEDYKSIIKKCAETVKDIKAFIEKERDAIAN